MHSDSGHTVPLWEATADVPDYPPLDRDLEADVCIVGAGLAGLSTAYHLIKAGRRVVVLDDGPVGGGESGRTTAHLASALDDRFSVLERVHGEEGSRLAAQSHMAAVHRIESIVREEGIDCDFTRLDGYLVLGEKDDAKILRQEAEAAERAGHAGIALLEHPPLEGWRRPALRFPDQGQFHVLKYLGGLARAVTRDGGAIFCGSHVSEIDTEGEHPVVKTSDGRTVRARALVVATNSPVNDWVALHTKQAPYRTYVVAFRIPRGAVPLALFWDTEDPYHYVRIQRDGEHDVLIVGGEDHKTGQADDLDARFARLTGWTRARFPAAQGEPDFQWSGQVMEPVDYLGFIGRDPAGQKNVYVATGDSGHGMTHATIAGMLLTDLIVGRDNPWEKLYDPSRISLRTGTEFLRENLNVAVQYRDYLTGGEVESASEIMPGSGAIIRRGTRKIAAYRDEQGTLHERSAVCTHLYCVVRWNDTERSWDCPCHGSRFDPHGNVLNGPASAPLERVEE